jgi:hypothetical protein
MQVTGLYEPPWTVLDAGELQLKLQRGLLRGNPARRRFQISEPRARWAWRLAGAAAVLPRD